MPASGVVVGSPSARDLHSDIYGIDLRIFESWGHTFTDLVPIDRNRPRPLVSPARFDGQDGAPAQGGQGAGGIGEPGQVPGATYLGVDGHVSASLVGRPDATRSGLGVAECHVWKILGVCKHCNYEGRTVTGATWRPPG